MSDVPPAGGVPSNGGAQAVPPRSEHPPFPAARLFYAFGFGIIAYFVCCVLLAVGAVQFIVVLINGEANAELKNFSQNLVQYLWELLAYITFVRDEQPFPIGPFPKH